MIGPREVCVVRVETIRQAGREPLSLALMDARNHTLHLLSHFEQGPAGAIFAGPLHPYAAGLIAAQPIPDPTRRRTEAPIVGKGLNPLLQDPAMIAHPPTLFLGYAGFTFPARMAAVAFSSPSNTRAGPRCLVCFRPATLVMQPSGASERSQIAGARALIYGLTGMVLLIVGLNISGMLLVRSAMRERELAIRLAIGRAADRRRSC